MKTRCPNCGATISLDSLITHDAARDALIEVFKLSGELGKAMMRYLGLFRPPNRDLSMDRVAKLVTEMTSSIQAQRIQRNRQVHEAPIEAWIWAMDQVVQARDSGRLTLPLKGHGYLYEVLTSWKPDESVVVAENCAAPSDLPRLRSKTALTLAALERLK